MTGQGYWHLGLPPFLFLWLRCKLLHGGHERYTHVHDGEPTITYCLRCRTTLKVTA